LPFEQACDDSHGGSLVSTEPLKKHEYEEVHLKLTYEGPCFYHNNTFNYLSAIYEYKFRKQIRVRTLQHI